jgi:hypothetical protein
MVKIIFGIFVILHGLVHLLYFGHGLRYFELPGLAWPDNSWLFSRLLGVGSTRFVAGIACVAAAAVFVVAGIAFFAGAAWWRPVLVGAAVFSSLIWILFWDGKMSNLSGQGLFAILINLGLVLAVQIFHWPE